MELSIKYQENRKKIVDIVRKYFGYTDETKNLFENIYNDRMPSLDVDYQNVLNKCDVSDFKIRRMVSDEIMEKLDSGYTLFKLYFSSFVKFYGITYKNFKEWKIEINKNMFKLQKALVNYYSDPKNLIHFAADVDCERNPDRYKTRVYSDVDITVKLKQVQEIVSERKLPNQNLELVMSFDFADWFLCSSAESWKSCLCLDSNFSACFWHGLPALMGDPNRCFIYMTNGQKKNYKGIEVDKVIARAWGIMGEDGTIYLNKSYPTKNFSAQDVKIIFPEFNFGSIEVLADKGKRVMSKNTITPFWMPDDRSEFIYSDLSTPRKTKKIEFGSISGGHWVFRKYSNGSIDVCSDSHFRYEKGLSNLIDKDVDIIAIGGHHSLRKCKICGSISLNQKLTEDGYICDNCYQKLPKCSYCGDRHEMKYMTEFEGKLYCKNCFTSRFSVCDICGKKALKEEFSSYERTVCKPCFNKFYFKCGACSSQTRIDRMKVYMNKVYCGNCETDKRGEQR